MNSHTEDAADFENLLPANFGDLAPFVKDWSLEQEAQRARQRWTKSLKESHQFYHAMIGRVEEALNYLDNFNLNDLPAPEQRLMLLTLSLAEVANTIETYKQPGVPHAYTTEQYVPTVFPHRL